MNLRNLMLAILLTGAVGGAKRALLRHRCRKCVFSIRTATWCAGCGQRVARGGTPLGPAITPTSTVSPKVASSSVM